MVAERQGTDPAAGSAPGTVAAGGWKPGDRGGAGVAQGELKQKAYVLLFLVACCGHGANLALPRTGDQQRADYVSERVHSGAPRQQPLETIAAVMRGVGLETGQRRVARRGLPRPAAHAGAGR